MEGNELREYVWGHEEGSLILSQNEYLPGIKLGFKASGRSHQSLVE